MNSKTPKVSVVMPVYNGEKYLREAIDSILKQTFTDFEFIIVDDGSHDSSVEIVQAYADPRIRLVCNEANLGLPRSLNRGISLAQGAYIARMDADDVSRPERLARQVAFLDAHSRCGIVGTWTEIWKESTRTERAHRHPNDSLAIKYEVLFDSPFVHSSVLIRKEVFEMVGLYPTDMGVPYPEDYALWSRIARAFELANLPECLLVYREVSDSMSRQKPAAFLNHVSAICADNLAYALGKPHPDQAITNLAAFVHGAYVGIPTPAHIVGWVSVLFKAADRLSDANHAPRGLLRRRAYVRARSILRTYSGQLRSSLKRRFHRFIKRP